MKNIFIMIGAISLLGITGVSISKVQKKIPDPVLCTQEVKLCEDGSYVGRTGVSCAFALCPGVATSTPPVVITLPAATSTAKLHQKIVIKDIIITPTSLIQDSRCPTDVQCIQAGTVKINVSLENGGILVPVVLTLGDSVSFMNKKVSLVSVYPKPSARKSISEDAYEFTFSVVESDEISKGTLSGTMTIGPICPVEHVDSPCLPTLEMYAAQKVFVYSSDKKTLLMTLVPNVSGKFQANLLPGSYYVDVKHPTTKIGSISGVPTTITIVKGVATYLTINIDTGMR